MAIAVKQPLSAEDRAIWEARLTEAQQAYHDLATGQLVASFTDQNGERVTYSKGEKWLSGYIADIVAVLGVPTTPSTAVSPRPMRFVF